jgi:hypothetical protein
MCAPFSSTWREEDQLEKYNNLKGRVADQKAG